jgi:ubiquinone/menaquinone biosynthesis C-methylase UbiE
MVDDTGNPFSAYYEAGASSYQLINNFKKDITREILKRCSPIDMNSVVLNNACGPGIVTGEIQNSATSSNMPLIYAVDFSPQMIHEFAQ